MRAGPQMSGSPRISPDPHPVARIVSVAQARKPPEPQRNSDFGYRPRRTRGTLPAVQMSRLRVASATASKARPARSPVLTNETLDRIEPSRRVGRAVEGARLESVCRATYRGFESHSLRHLISMHSGFDLGNRRLPVESHSLRHLVWWCGDFALVLGHGPECGRFFIGIRSSGSPMEPAVEIRDRGRAS